MAKVVGSRIIGDKLTLDEIIDYCQKNGKVEWLKKTAALQCEYKVYPRVSVMGDDGKLHFYADKTQKPTIEVRPISFFDLRQRFNEEVLGKKKAPKKVKKTMYTKIAAL